MSLIIIIILLLVACLICLVYSFRKVKTSINNKIDNFTQQFYTTLEYPELKILEDNWKVIASEIPPFDVNKLDQYPKRERSAWNNEEGKKLAEELKSTWVQGWQGDKIWYNFPLMYHNKVIDTADKVCPKTIELLKTIPSIQIVGYSILLPKSELPVHNDLTGKKDDSMACNFLLTPNNASLYVKNDLGAFRENKHQLGKIVIFDSNYDHYADNKDDKIRVIMYIDFKVDTMFGEKRSGDSLGTKIGYPTVNIKLDRDYECGFYFGKSGYGDCVIIVNGDNKYAEVHFKDYNKNRHAIDTKDRFYLYGVHKISSNNADSIIEIYNRSCNIKNTNN